MYVGHTLNWFCDIETVTSTLIQCRTPKISDAYSVGTAVQVVASTRLLILNKCVNNCDFTYLSSASSPALTSNSHPSPQVKGSNTKTVTLTGTNLVDSNNFADVAFKHTITKQTTAFTAASATAT